MVDEFKPDDCKSEFFTNEETLIRFFIARKCDYKKSLEMWTNWIKWYNEFRPDLITEESLSK